jgi:ATP-dependent Lon protease
VNKYLVRESERIALREKIHVRAHGALSQAQREFFLREQLKAIQKELGEGEDAQKDIEEFRQRIEAAGMPAEIKAEALKELKRLSALSPISPEHAVSVNYLEWMVSLPPRCWTRITTISKR